MSLVRYEPFNLLDRFQKDFTHLGLFNPIFNEVLADDNTDVAISHWRPAVDIREEDKQFVIKADIPGVDPKDIEITMEDGVLTIKGERTTEKEEKREDYRRVERSRGTFYRRFSLPDTANAEKIEATGKDGHDKVLPRRISVKG